MEAYQEEPSGTGKLQEGFTLVVVNQYVESTLEAATHE